MKNKVLIAILSCLMAVGTVLADSYYDQRVSLFDLLPVDSDDIIFLGNSITDGGEFSELLDMPNVKNRGIRSDVIRGVQKRLDQILRGKPKKIFLLIGINDVSHNLTVSQLAERYEELVKQIRSQSPDTKLYLQSVMPINNDFKRYKNLLGKERTIKLLNDEIMRIAIEQNCVFIDLTPALADPSTGKLQRSFTNDGLHLTGAGYKAWRDAIINYVSE